MERNSKKPRRFGGVLSDRVVFEDAKIQRRRGERLTSFGYFTLEGKQYVIVAYFPTFRYWWTFIRNFPTHMSSFLFPGAYLRSKNIDELVQGIRVYNNQSELVRYDRGVYLNALRAVRVWIRVYLDPFYPPKPRYFDARLAILRRVTEISRRRRGIKLRDVSREFYIDQIRKADDQMLQYLGTLERHNVLLHGLSKTFVSVSDSPSSLNMNELLRKARRFKALLQELESSCEQRAKSWPDMKAAQAALGTWEESNENAVKKFGPRALADGLIGVVFGILSGGSLAVGFLFSVSSELGLGFLRNFVLGPKRQVKNLLAAADSYRKAVARVDSFLSLYELQPGESAFRT